MIELGLIDIKGNIRTRSFIDKTALRKSFGFDGSSVGLAPIEDSDLIAVPDKSFKKVYKLKGDTIEFYLCNVYKEAKPYSLDLRAFLKRYLSSYPYRVEIGPEIEFYLLEGEHKSNTHYMMPYPLDRDKPLIRNFMKELNALGYGVKLEHSEVGEGQHEITISHDEASKMADKIAFYKYYARIFFAEEGRTVTFLPKPYIRLNGSGMHLHISLERKDNRKRISFLRDKEGKMFIAGLLNHIREITAFLNSTENSYKRLVPGFEAPCYRTWGVGNRSCLIRIPSYHLEKDQYRIELRSPDPQMNPYLGIIAILEAGIKGIEEKAQLEPPIKENVYSNPEYRSKTLPKNLEEAIEIAKKSKLVKGLGLQFFKFLEYIEKRAHSVSAFKSKNQFSNK